MSFYWLNADSRRFLNDGYVSAGQTVEERVKVIADTAESILKIDGFSDKLYDYISKGWISLSSPIWANFGCSRGLPISCFGSYMEDSVESILGTTAEIGMMTKQGGGCSVYMGALRGRGAPISMGGKSTGSVHFMQLLETTTQVISQSNVRRGHCKVTLPIDHPDFLEFLNIREDGNLIQNLSMGCSIRDEWMLKLKAGDKECGSLWRKIIKKRFETGFPYVFFHDNVNSQKPQVYKDLDMEIWHSNMCQEIMEPNSVDESFVCDLLSFNLLKYDEWKDTDVVEVGTFVLDSVMTEFIEKASNIKYMERAVRFAERHRALGLGALGWHSLLQEKMIPFESMEAKMLNAQIFKQINSQSLAASQKLAQLYGETELTKGYGVRNTVRMAVAPTTSSAFALGQVSQSIEPWDSNYFVKELSKGKFTIKNPKLKEVLKSYNKDTKDVWDTIMNNGGSVQTLSFLTDLERNVFKTFGEISQMEIAIQASQRQKFIDQGQSLNFKIHPDTPLKEVSQLMIWCWENGIKTLYYQHGTNPAQKLSRELLNCVSCEA